MNHLATKTLLALGCAGALATSASAQTTAYATGDYLLGFREVGSTDSVVVDIGQFAPVSMSMTFPVNAGATLAAQYGSNWATNPNVYFSVSSTDGARTNSVTSPEYSTGPNAGPAAIWSRLTSSNALVLQNKINALGNEYTNAAAGNANTNPTIPPYSGSGGELQSNTDADAYQNFMPGGHTDNGHAGTANISYGDFNPTIEGNFGQGTSGVLLDLIQLPPGSPGTPGNDLGVFQLSSNGNTLTFTTEAAVPEPAGLVTAGVWGVLALLCFQIIKCRKSSTKEQSA